MRKTKIVLSFLALASFTLTGCQKPTSTATSVSTSPVSTSATPVSTSTIADEDVVAETKIKLADGLFDKIMANKSTANYDTNKLDFQDDGVERMLTSSDYAPNKDSDVFVNYVDGDTTHFTTYNGKYTVKVRYLGVDTPESTSEIEVWGKSASNFNKGILKAAKHIIVQSAGCALTGNPTPADVDGYQRSLAYVWYTDVEKNPTQNDFRNLNLELVYQGFSLFSGRESEMDPAFYAAFTKANDIAKGLKRHMFSDEVDANYYYGSPKALGLDKLYDTTYYTTEHKRNVDDNGKNYSVYCDYYTRWTFEGVVSRRVGNAFYIQNTIAGKTYGLYVFTLRSYAPVKVGNRIKVTGVLSFYGGSYELGGISYNFFNHQEGDIEYVTDANGNKVTETVTPIDATPAEIDAGKYDGVLVNVVKDSADASQKENAIYFNTYDNNYGSLPYGGTEEVNGYNDAHPFYNTDNSLVLFGKYGSDMTAVTSGASVNPSAPMMRVKVAQDIILSGDYTTSDGTTSTDQKNAAITSYKFFTGGTHYYIPGDAEAVHAATAAKPEPVPKTGETLYTTVFKRKKVTKMVGIAANYMSTSGKTMFTLNVCDINDFSGFTEVA